MRGAGGSGKADRRHRGDQRRRAGDGAAAGLTQRPRAHRGPRRRGGGGDAGRHPVHGRRWGEESQYPIRTNLVGYVACAHEAFREATNEEGVKVTLIEPGKVSTDMIDKPDRERQRLEE